LSFGAERIISVLVSVPYRGLYRPHGGVIGLPTVKIGKIVYVALNENNLAHECDGSVGEKIKVVVA
jgi:hypothetical protein